MQAVVHWESGSSGFINSCTSVSFAIAALNANVYRLKDSHSISKLLCSYSYIFRHVCKTMRSNC